MKKIMRILGVVFLAAVAGITACKHDGTADDSKLQVKNDKAAGQEMGVELLIADADLIQVDDNPQYNTAEWLFTVKKPGRYDVWLSSLTCDTLQLSYAENVIITAGDSRLTKKPVGDEIVTDDKSVKEPWYRADSHMGSIFFSKPGEYQIQVISDKVEPHSSDLSDLNISKHTLINSLILKPMVN
jgi:hypothetical protein